MSRRLRLTLFRLRALLRAGFLALSFLQQKGFRALWAKLTSPRPAEAAAPALPAAPPPGAELDVIYAIGYWPGEPKRYRVFNPAAALTAAGYRVHLLDYSRIDEIIRFQWRAKVLVLFRAPYDRLIGLEAVLGYARSKGIKVVFDIDDLIFDKTLLGRIDGIQALSWWERRGFAKTLELHRKLLLRADLVTAPTEALCRAAQTAGRPAQVLRNALNTEQLALAEGLAGRPDDAETVRIGYFSGSRTHQKDFAQCEAALLAILARHSRAEFWLVGYLELGESWQPFAGRIKRIGFMPAAEMLRCLAEIDINIAPLEVGNPFCEAKSELKFFEAGLVGVPTIASATEPFRQAIIDGESGFIARNDAEWERALERLVTDASERRRIGQGARDRALARFGPEETTRQIVSLFALTPSKGAA